ncbi:MAG: hypothetical protein M3O67_04710, partial [Bacteroidota bacterium]|nr:hypothetical protein [Bacteroidota bacterium]
MKLLIYLTPVFLFAGCNTGEQSDSSSKTSKTSSDSTRTVYHTDTVYMVRNAEITPANSYSDLFLDSKALEYFIQQKKIPGDEARGIRSFYNYRNLQFAWFTSQGFTEQARGFWNLQDKLENKTSDKTLR